MANARGQEPSIGAEGSPQRLAGLPSSGILRLAPGLYTGGIRIHGLFGRPEAPIVIEGPASGPPAVFLATPGRNTISILNSGYVTIRHLVLDGRNLPVDAVKCEGRADFAHHITLENLTIRGHGHNQQTVGISTKCPAWNWVIRGNTIIGAGTGMYLGNSDGRAPFVAGLIENNLIVDSVGYNLQIKHQAERPQLPGLPVAPSQTVIRRNVFAKTAPLREGAQPRPNVLVGHWPKAGAGTDDRYLIHGNLFYGNPAESLFQGEGNLALYNNVFVAPERDAIRIQPHNDVPKRVVVAYNTILARGAGIVLARGPGSEQFEQTVSHNAVFAGQPLVGVERGDNAVGPLEAAADHLVAPRLGLEGLDLRPQTGALRAARGWSGGSVLPGLDSDFEGVQRNPNVVGAYTWSPGPLRWRPALEHMPPMTERKTHPRRPLLPLAVAYLAFVVYGSLVPLDYQPLPLKEALARFRDIRYLDLGVGSRADWVANILLFVPLAFLWLGVAWHRWNAAARLAASLGLWLAAVALSVGIEFTQLFFPPRTVSQNDILAEALGAAIGVVAWWLSGPRLLRWLGRLRDAAPPLDFARRVLYVYLAGLVLYNVLPLDLTLSPVELWHKLREGRLVWLPFGGLPSDPAQAAYDLATDALIWAPVGFLWRRGPFWGALRRVLLAAALIEFLQLWVYSRVTDTTDVVMAVLGGGLGAWLAGRLRPQRWPAGPAAGARGPAPGAMGWLAGLAVWSGLLGAVFWFPYDFDFDRGFLSERLGSLARAPFTAYYYGTEYRAATEVLHKLLFFLPLGVLLQGALRAVTGISPRGRLLAAAVAIGGVAAGIEGMQLALPGKNADLTDWGIELIGGVLGALLAARWWSLSAGTRADAPSPGLAAGVSGPPEVRPATVAGVPPSAPVGVWVAGLLAALGAGLWLAGRLPFVPYNVRELIGGGHGLLSALLLAVALVWVFGFPAFAVGRYAKQGHGLGALAAAFVLHGVVAWFLLRAAVPLESLHDIVGSPVLDWPWEWELLGRFLGLFLLWSLAAFGAAMLLLRAALPRLRAPLVVWSAALPVLLALSYFVVVAQAATDNLTELLAHRASPGAFLWLWSAFLILAVAGAALGVVLGSRLRRGAAWGLALATLSPLLAYLALGFALESHIVKYGRVFSAFQFLLSSDRAHYAQAGELALRYVIAYLALLAVAAASAAPFLGPAASTQPRPADAPVRRQKERGQIGPDG